MKKSFQKKAEKLTRGVASHLQPNIHFASGISILRAVKVQIFCKSLIRGRGSLLKWSEDLSAGHSHSDLPVVWPFSRHSIFSDFVKIFFPNLLIVEQIFTSGITALVVVSRIELETILDKGYSSMNMPLSFALQKKSQFFYTCSSMFGWRGENFPRQGMSLWTCQKNVPEHCTAELLSMSASLFQHKTSDSLLSEYTWHTEENQLD